MDLAARFGSWAVFERLPFALSTAPLAGVYRGLSCSLQNSSVFDMTKFTETSNLLGTACWGF